MINLEKTCYKSCSLFDKFRLELYAIKENENNNCEVEPTSSKDTLTSIKEYKVIIIAKEVLSIIVKSKIKYII